MMKYYDKCEQELENYTFKTSYESALDYYNYMLQNDLFSVYPLISCVKNFGFDGSGINNSNMKPILNLSISKTELEVLPRDLNNELDKEIFKKYFLKYYSPPFLFKLIYKLFGIKLWKSP